MPAKALAQQGLTEAQIRRGMLYAKGTRVDSFRFEHWGATGYLRDLTGLVVQESAAIEHVGLGEIHGSFRCKLINEPLLLRSYQNQISKDRPAVFLRNNTTAGSVVTDFSGNGRHGAVNGAVELKRSSLLTGEPSDFSFGFPGTSTAFVSLPTNAVYNVGNKWSVELMLQGKGTAGALFELTGKMSLTQLANGKLQLIYVTSDSAVNSIDTESVFNDDNRYHLRIVSDGQFIRIFSDFALQAERAETRNLFGVNNGWKIGQNYTGLIDEFAFYTYDLTEYQGRIHFQTAFKDTSQIFFGHDEIKAFYGFYVGSQLVEWSMGMFALTIPDDQIGDDLNKEIEVIGFDRLVYLIEDTFDTRYLVPKDTPIVAKVVELIQSTGWRQVSIEPNAALTTKDIEFAAGTSKKKAVNELLKLIAYFAISPDENGVALSKKYRSPNERPVDIVYKDNEISVITPRRSLRRDFTKTPNRFVGYTSSLETGALTKIDTNTAIKSRSSKVNRRRWITTVSQYDAVDQASLDLQVRKAKDDAEGLNTEASYGTLNNPTHTHLNKVRIEDSRMNLAEEFIETRWKIEFKAGATMEHELRKTVSDDTV